MPLCEICSSAIAEDAQFYMTSDMGPEMIAVIEKNLEHEIPEAGILCAQCFEGVSTSPTSPSSGTPTVPLAAPETNICVHCRTSLFTKRCQMVRDGPERELIAKRISPRTVPDGSRVCFKCWAFIHNSLQAQGITTVTSTPTANTNNCVRCQASLARRRRHAIPDGPERDEIVRNIHPREIPPGGLVCYTCWIAVCRHLKRASEVKRSPEPYPTSSHYKDVCVWCNISLFRRRTHVLSGEAKYKVAERIHPREMPKHALVCVNCHARAQEMVDVHRHGLVIEMRTQNPEITLDNYSHTPSTGRRCFVPGCNNTERQRVPAYIRKRILLNQKIFVTDTSKICLEHKCSSDWDFLKHHQFPKTFNKYELEAMLNLSIEEIDLEAYE